MRFIERLLFGKDGVRRAEEAEARLDAAFKRREVEAATLEQARAKLRTTVEECERQARKISSEPPPVIRFVVPDSDVEMTPVPRPPPLPRKDPK